MPRIPVVTSANANPAQQELLDGVSKKFGKPLNMFSTAINSPATTKALLGMFENLGKGKLGAKLGEQIAIAIANRNSCEYCLAAHTAIGKSLGVSEQALADAQVGKSDDAKTAAVLKFVINVVDKRAHVTDADISELRLVGLDDEAIVEIIGHVAINHFTNYLNIIGGVAVDFPAVKLAGSKAA